MRIGVDARYAFRKTPRGIGRSLRNLLRTLAGLDRENEYVLYVDALADAPAAGSHPGGAAFSFRRLEAPNPALWEQWALPRAAGADRLDLLHAAANMAPAAATCPTILTLYDLIEFKRHSFGDTSLTLRHRLARAYRMGLVPRVARQADLIITVSRHSRRDIFETLCVPPEKVEVIPVAPDPSFFEPVSRQAIERATRRLGVRGRFLLSLAALDRRKNHAVILEAFARCKDRLPPDLGLVLAGSEDPSRLGLERHPAWLAIRDRVTALPFVPDEDLRALYAGAEAFVFTSLYEGFGLPPLEAMAAGAPVICSNATSLPEVVGDAALLFDPRDPLDLAEKLAGFFAEPRTRLELVGLGRERARCFSWEDIGRATMKAYERVAGSAGRE